MKRPLTRGIALALVPALTLQAGFALASLYCYSSKIRPILDLNRTFNEQALVGALTTALFRPGELQPAKSFVLLAGLGLASAIAQREQIIWIRSGRYKLSRFYRTGQHAVGRDGLLPAQKTRMAKMLENHPTLKPRSLSPEELIHIADFIEKKIKNRANEAMHVIKEHFDLRVWWKLYDAVDLLRQPEQEVTLNGRRYRFEIKSIPGDKPIEFEGTYLWGISDPEEPSSRDGVGRITLYVPEVENYDQIPERLAGLIHAVLEYLIFPQDSRIHPRQHHLLAFILEAVIDGEIIRATTEKQKIAVPRRAIREMLLIPNQAQYLDFQEKKGHHTDYFRKFPSHESSSQKATDYLTQVMIYIQKERAKLMDRPSPDSSSPSPSRPAPVYNAAPSELPGTENINLPRRAEVKRYIQSRMSQGAEIVEIEEMASGTVSKLPMKEAIQAAEQGLLLVKAPKFGNGLCWATQWRQYMVGGKEDGTEFDSSLRVRFSREAFIVIESLQFKVSVQSDEEAGRRPHPVFLPLISGEGPFHLKFGEPLQGGRIHGEYVALNQRELDPRHFEVMVLRFGEDDYELQVRTLGQRGLSVRSMKARATGMGSAPSVGFLGSGYFMFAAEWLGTQFLKTWRRQSFLNRQMFYKAA